MRIPNLHTLVSSVQCPGYVSRTSLNRQPTGNPGESPTIRSLIGSPCVIRCGQGEGLHGSCETFGPSGHDLHTIEEDLYPPTDDRGGTGQHLQRELEQLHHLVDLKYDKGEACQDLPKGREGGVQAIHISGQGIGPGIQFTDIGPETAGLPLHAGHHRVEEGDLRFKFCQAFVEGIDLIRQFPESGDHVHD